MKQGKEWNNMIKNLERTLKKYPDTPEAKKAAKLMADLKKVEITDDSDDTIKIPMREIDDITEKIPVFANPIFGKNNGLIIILGIVGVFMYMKNSSKKSIVAHDPAICPECHEENAQESEISLAYLDITPEFAYENYQPLTYQTPTREL